MKLYMFFTLILMFNDILDNFFAFLNKNSTITFFKTMFLLGTLWIFSFYLSSYFHPFSENFLYSWTHYT